MKILVFTEGTIIMHSSAKGLSREERVKQSQTRERSVHDYRDYIPNDNSVEKLLCWKKQGAEIYYLTSRTTSEEIDDVKFVLEKYSFPNNQNLLYREKGEEYKDVAEKLMPDIIVEDDCESIGGEVEMTYPHIREDKKPKIKSIVVKEFGGIDYLPNELSELKKY